MREVSTQLSQNGVDQECVCVQLVLGSRIPNQQGPPVARAIFRLAHVQLRLSEDERNGWLYSIRLNAYGFLQIIFLLLPVAMVIGLFQYQAAKIWATLQCCLALSYATECIAFRTGVPRRFLRQLALMLGWPFIHAAIVTAYSSAWQLFIYPVFTLTGLAGLLCVVALVNVFLKGGTASDCIHVAGWLLARCCCFCAHIRIGVPAIKTVRAAL